MKTSLDHRSVAAKVQRAIDDSLFDWPSRTPALLAGECTVCDAQSFPRAAYCPACGSEAVETRKLPTRGTLWTWTIQRFMPKPPYHSSENPETFVPFGLGYVELSDRIRVESRLLENAAGKLHIGMPMQLTFYVHRTDADGSEIVNYAFEPVDPEGGV